MRGVHEDADSDVTVQNLERENENNEFDTQNIKGVHLSDDHQ